MLPAPDLQRFRRAEEFRSLLNDTRCGSDIANAHDPSKNNADKCSINSFVHHSAKCQKKLDINSSHLSDDASTSHHLWETTMSEPDNREKDFDRRNFLKFFGAAGAAASVIPINEVANAQEKKAVHNHDTKAVPATRVADAGYEYLNTDEAAFIEAALDTIIPADSTGPGAKELGVALYIDRQMAGGFGKGDRLYIAGPYAEGTPQQGYQLPLTPSELLRAGIADVNALAQSTYSKPFDGLSAEARVTMLQNLESGKSSLNTVPADTFFSLLLQLTIEGYFSDPLYGGNKDKAAWAMIGFPGADAMYMDKIEPFRNKPYKTEPKGIQDLI